MKKSITVKQELIKEKALLGQKIYLSDLPEFKNNDVSILHNTIFNKVICGIGATTVALKSKDSIIILMPFIELVNNKKDVVENTFAVKGSVTVKDITYYLMNTSNRKIISTYDGLRKLIEAYEKAGLDIYKDFLLVDEFQTIFSQYAFRGKVMKFLLKESLNFNKKCFMSATPIKKEYWFDEFKGLTELTLDYDIEPVTIRHYKSENIVDETIAIIQNQSKEKNLHFFINSVDTIKAINKIIKLPKEDVRIVCSQRDRNQVKLNDYKIETTKDPVKKINFYTSTVFEGVDIYDKDGRIFVLSDGDMAHSLIDISTTLPQISGRIRDIEDTSVNLVYKTTRYSNKTQEDFDADVKKNMREAEKLSKSINDEVYKLLDGSRDMSIKLSGYYLFLEDGKARYERVFHHIDKLNFEMSKTYNHKANVIAKLPDVFTPIEEEKPWADEIKEIERLKIKGLSFKEQCLHRINESNPDEDYSNLVIEAISKLGIERLEELNYHRGDVTKALTGILDASDEVNIAKAIKLNKQEFYSSAYLKSMFEDIYSKLNINANAKATDINNYYEVKGVMRRIDGKPTRGYIILNKKLIIK